MGKEKKPVTTTSPETSTSKTPAVENTEAKDESLESARAGLDSSAKASADPVADPDVLANAEADKVIGQKLNDLVGKWLWRGSEASDARAAVTPAWRAAFVAAHKTATGSDKTKRKQASKAGDNAVKADLKTRAIQSAKDRAAADVASGAAFGSLDTEAQGAKDDYEGGTGAQKAVELSAALAGLTGSAQKARCDTEVPSNATYAASPLSSGKAQHGYTFTDGSMVRLKPEGDDLGSTDAMYAVEVMKKGSTSATSQDDIAFKVDASGKPVPKGPADVANPYNNNAGYQKDQVDPYLSAVMGAGHLTAKK
ncbi:MAG: hypothetical protein AB8H79_02825 [Myxococcota bacterium]